MGRRFWLVVGAMALSLALLVPSVAPLTQSMDAFAQDLANGTFRPFGTSGVGPAGQSAFSSSLGGLTGSSSGNYLPGATELPPRYAMDRDGGGGHVTIDYVFNPALGAMKRLKVFDRINEDGTVLEVSDERLRVVERDPQLRYDTLFEGKFEIAFHPNKPVPIYSPHPKATVQNARVDATIPGGFSIFKDGADTYYAFANYEGVVTLDITYRADSDYYNLRIQEGTRVTNYPPALRPLVSDNLRDEAELVLSRAGVTDAHDVGQTLNALNAYFRAFGEGPIPPPSEVESLYLALAVGENGCCRHRAFAYMITAQAAGIPTRVVTNEAHAFVEVAMPNGHWYQVNLGGCGTYVINNSEGYPSFSLQSEDPRAEAETDKSPALREAPSITEITESPPRIQKGERYFVNGTVLAEDGRPVQGARVDVFLNETKEAPGQLTGAGTTGADGRFSVEARVPKELPARSYQLVARGNDGRNGDVRYLESWSDPPVDVFTPTRLIVPQTEAAVGVPTFVRGRLVDVDDAPVPDARIQWKTDDANGTVATDSLGRFALEVTFPTVGAHTVRLVFDGDEHRGRAQTTASVDVREGAILLPAEPPTLVRGQSSPITATIALAGADVGHRSVEVRFVGFRSGGATQTVAQTNAKGVLDLVIVPDANTPPGAYALRFEAHDLGLVAEGPARIAIRPTLTAAAPELVSSDTPWMAQALLVSDDGRPVAGQLVELTLDANASTRRQLLTNSSGIARFEFPEDTLNPGVHALAFSFPGNSDHVAAQATATLEVTAPFLVRIPAWMPGVLILVVGLIGAGVYLFGREHAGRRFYERAVAGGVLPTRQVLSLRFPEHPPGVPPVTEPGSPTRIEVLATDKLGKPARMSLRLDAGDVTHRARTDSNGLLQWDAALGDHDGVLSVRVRARGFARLTTVPVARPLMVASYREAIERAFVGLRHAAQLAPSTTAGDLLDALKDRLDGAERASLADMARLFDVADYSEAPIGRESYHRFVTARLRILHALAQTEEAAPNG